jgi:hypothetical protein
MGLGAVSVTAPADKGARPAARALERVVEPLTADELDVLTGLIHRHWATRGLEHGGTPWYVLGAAYNIAADDARDLRYPGLV